MDEDDGLDGLREEISQLNWPIFFLRVPQATMDRFTAMTKDVEGDTLARFQYLMNEAGWGE